MKPTAKLKLGTLFLSLYKNTKNYRHHINTKLQKQSHKKLQKLYLHCNSLTKIIYPKLMK